MTKKRAHNTGRERRLQHLESRLSEAEENLKANEAQLDRVKEIQAINEEIQAGIDTLVRFAKDGERFAGPTLANVANSAVGQLSDLARRQPKMFLPLSRKVFAWPAFVSPKRAITERNKELLKLLEVGKRGIYSQRKWQMSAPSTDVVMGMFGLAHDLAATGHLPRLTPKTKRKWFNKSWDTLLRADWKPEEDPRVASLGKSKAMRKPRYCKTLHPPTQRANVRAAIKAKLWKTFDDLIVAEHG